ncbi:uncharacterized protein LOC128953265 isoform X1 [Oppia nitens]|uniref:uncharacterized protein LOC128953265 isoform X1 n=1 Tax=Oppia nitens TaxID=1686743 RepID=UPI0023DCEB4E|nr:uncharacterized protein LOC128953265 isoform X1 [Oppia nitens]
MIQKVIILALVAYATCSPLVNDAKDDANKFVDQLIQIVKTKYGDKLDPMHLNDTVAEFHKKIAGITWHGDAKLTEGTIWGLKNISRSGDSKIDIAKTISAHLQFGDANLKIHYKGELQFMDLKTSGSLEAYVDKLDVIADIGADDKGKLHVNGFNIDELKHVRIDFHGPIKVADHIIDALADGFVDIFNKQTRELLSKVVKDLLEKELQNLHFPPSMM